MTLINKFNKFNPAIQDFLTGKNLNFTNYPGPCELKRVLAFSLLPEDENWQLRTYKFFLQRNQNPRMKWQTTSFQGVLVQLHFPFLNACIP